MREDMSYNNTYYGSFLFCLTKIEMKNFGGDFNEKYTLFYETTSPIYGKSNLL